jgi:NAD(P)-dependent dehydrogenase (short-subunit alcohol dehydrogenase family)
MQLLEGDAIVIAGATGRVGGATLTTLLREGARLVVISRSRARAANAIAALGGPDAAGRAIPFEADATDPAAAAAAIATCVERYGRIDALANLAGAQPRIGALVDSSVDDLRANVVAYVETAYNLALPAVRAMLAQPYRDGALSRGRIVTVTAGSSRDPAPRRGLFGVAKAGVNTLMRAIAREHKADGIVANALVLGGVQIEESRERRGPEAYAAAASPQEVADTIAFLCSARGSGINGELVDLNARETD